MPHLPYGLVNAPVYALGSPGQFLVDTTGGIPPQPNWRQVQRGVTAAYLLQRQAGAVADLITQVQAAQADSEMNALLGISSEMSLLEEGGGAMAMMSYSADDLWLELTAKTNTTGLFVIHPPELETTNCVYDLFLTTNLNALVPGLNGTNWQWVLRTAAGETNLVVTNLAADECYFRLGKTNDVDGDGLSDAFEMLVSHSNPTNPFTAGLPDLWEWLYFGNCHQSATNDYDGDGFSNGLEYTNATDPNSLRFSISVANRYFNSSSVTLPLNILGGVPASVAVLVNSTNFIGAAWQPYTSTNLVVTLSGGDGDYTVRVGLRGRQEYSQQTWQAVALTRDTVPPVITVTNPAGATASQPIIQLQGYVSETLAGLTYDLTNAACWVTNQSAFIVGAHPDTNIWKFTTNYFQGYDLALTNGANLLMLRATDLAGNTSTTNLTVTLDYSGDTNAPFITVNWPPHNTSVAGSNFTLSGQLDDATAVLRVSSGAGTNVAVVKRNGKFAVADLPLPGATNTFSLTATDVAGNHRTASLTVLKSTVSVTVTPLSGVQLSQPSLTLTGTVSDSGKKVRANGIDATVNLDGTWEAVNVPVRATAGGGEFLIAIYPSGSDPNTAPPEATQTLYITLPPLVRATGYTENYGLYASGSLGWTEIRTRNRTWKLNAGGSSHQYYEITGGGSCHTYVTWPTNWPGGETAYGSYTCLGDAYAEATVSAWQHCDLLNLFTEGGFTDDGTLSWFTIWYALSRTADTRIELVASESTRPDAQQLIRLTARAAAYSNRLDNLVPQPLTSGNGSFDGFGQIALPAASIQILGQTLTATATNANVGEMYVTLPAGANRELPVSVSGGTNYSFDVQAEGVTLRIFSGTNDVTDQTNTVIVGQQINLHCALSLTNVALTNFQWTVPGYAISNYVADSSSGIVYSNFPTVLSNVVFYWVDGANNRVIECSAMVGGQKIVANMTFNVLRPTASLTVITTTNQPAVNVVPAESFEREAPPYYFTFGTTTNAIDGKLTNSFGIRFYGQVTTLTNGAGTIAFVQVVTSALRAYTASDGTKWKHASHGTNYVDGFLSAFRFGSTDISASETRTAYTEDTPGNGLNCDEKARSVNDQFKTYIVYQPTNGIWVTLRSVNWYWNGAATNTASANCSWIRVSGSASANPTSSDDTELPIWSGNIPDLVYGPPEPDL